MPVNPSLPVSGYVICQDEEAHIAACLESLDCCREIVVVDSGSTDDTLPIIERLIASGKPIRLFQRPWPGFAAQKQFALDMCREDWCLCLDADERLDDALKATLPDLIRQPEEVAGIRLMRRPYFYPSGPAPKGVRGDDILRLTRRGRAHYDLTSRVHERLVLDGRAVEAKIGEVLHDRGMTFAEMIDKQNRYSTLKAEAMLAAGRRPHAARLLFNPLVYFVRQYVFRRFFLAGWAGFIHAASAAIYAFMVEAKLFQVAAVRKA